MKNHVWALALGLIGAGAAGSAALAQTPPAAPKPPAPAAQPAPPQAATPPAPPQSVPQPQQQAGGPGQPAIPAPSGPPEGMIVETPNGFFLVRPGDPNPRRLDLAGGRPMAPGAGPGGQPGDEAMDAPGDDGPQPPPGPRGRPMPPRPPEGKGAHFNIKTPNLTLSMKCPDDEPVKACVDAVSQLIDKAAAPGPQGR